MKNWHRDTPNAPVMPYNTLIHKRPMNYNSNSLPHIIITISFFVIFVAGMTVGAEILEPDHINIGRNQGIMLCSEKPDQCKIEYQYLKLKENQK